MILPKVAVASGTAIAKATGLASTTHARAPPTVEHMTHEIDHH